MGAKIYTTNNGLKATKKELIEMLDKYTLNELNEFYYSIFDRELKDELKAYFIGRMLSHGGLEK